jgi:hypothetical protein
MMLEEEVIEGEQEGEKGGHGCFGHCPMSKVVMGGSGGAREWVRAT